MSIFKYAIVCIDDDPFILQMLNFQISKLINERCVLLESFLSPDEALIVIDELVEIEINLIFIIVDYQMPKMNGSQFIREVKDKYPNMPCVMLSGEANQIQIEELQSDNLLLSFIAKPWDANVLKSAMEPWLNKLKC